MRFFHLCARNGNYHYVARIPVDLQQHFPRQTLYFSLHTKDFTFAKAQAGAIESELFAIYSVLRSPMIDSTLADYMVNKFLLARLIKIRQRDQRSARASKPRRMEILTEEVAFDRQGLGLNTAEGRKNRIEYLQAKVDELKADLDCTTGKAEAAQVARRYSKGKPIRLKPDEREWLGRRLQDAEIESLEWDIEVIKQNKREFQGRIDELKKKCEGGYILLADVCQKFIADYASKQNPPNPARERLCEIETGVLLSLIGNIPINSVNRMETITSLKMSLRKYRNRQGGKAVQKHYIKPKTANKYIMRFNALMQYAQHDRLLQHPPIKCELFPVIENPTDLRRPYEQEDFARLADALCTKPLWLMGNNRDERFWGVLFSAFHGIEASRIYGIQKQFVIFEDDMWKIKTDTWTTAKNAARIEQELPLHPDLIEIGFVRWVQKSDEGLIFKEKAKDFGQWYNRRSMSQKGEYQGFECKYITTDERKCLYSTRHSFGTGLYEAEVDVKAIKDLMGHTIARSDTTRRSYISRSTAKRLRVEIEQYHPFTADDVERLRLRAEELFKL